MDTEKGTVALAGMGGEEAATLTGCKGDPERVFASLGGVLAELYGQGYRSFSCVMREGFNLPAADAVARMKEAVDATIRLKAVVPYPTLAEDLDPEWLPFLRNVLLWADYTKIVSDYPVGRCLHAAADYLLADCALLVCYWNGHDGQTAYTVRGARERGIPVQNIYECFE